MLGGDLQLKSDMIEREKSLASTRIVVSFLMAQCSCQYGVTLEADSMDKLTCHVSSSVGVLTEVEFLVGCRVGFPRRQLPDVDVQPQNISHYLFGRMNIQPSSREICM